VYLFTGDAYFISSALPAHLSRICSESFWAGIFTTALHMDANHHHHTSVHVRAIAPTPGLGITGSTSACCPVSTCWLSLRRG
jgi:hypothetical protein